MKIEIVRQTPVLRSARVMQLEGIFEVQPDVKSEVRWSADFPLDDRDWQVGLIVGPSGSGKSTIARELFGENIVAGYDWPKDKSIVDAFPADLGIKDITATLSSVGFSSPPSWLRPFHVLSNGEQFRVTLARALVDPRPLVAIDEFTSVVDRTVAQIGSHAVAKTIRRTPGKRFVAISCHYDIIDWLQPDWMFDPSTNQFQWRSLQRRPAITLDVVRVTTAAWDIFKHHHYMSTDIHRAAKCFVGCIDGRPAVFAAVLPFPHAHRPGWRGHRTVCLPDFQGAGIGNAMTEFIGSVFKSTGKPYFSTTANPAMTAHRARSKLWRMSKAPSKNVPHTGRLSETVVSRSLQGKKWQRRIVAGFEFLGPANIKAARELGVI
jgi:GTPase SAR1 family protein